MRVEVEGLFVQVSGVTSEADALMAVAFGADAVGFDFGPSDRQVSATLVYDIVRRLPSGCLAVGAFHSEMPERVVEIVGSLGLHVAQLDGVMSADAVRYVASRVRTVVRSVDAPDDAYDHEADTGVDYILAPGPWSSASPADFAHVVSDSLMIRPVIAAGLSATQAAALVSAHDVWGVDVLSQVESSPGVKDPSRLSEFISTVRDARALGAPGRTWPPEEWS